MEALVALSLAGNVVQFVEFGIKAIKNVRNLYKSADGVVERLSEMEKEAVDQAQFFETRFKGSDYLAPRPSN
jgi:hypothetical protein